MSRNEMLARRVARHAPVVSVILACSLVLLGLAVWALRPSGASASSASHGAAEPPLVPPPPSALQAGATVPDFVVPALRAGQPPVSLADFRGRPVVLNFFASWCHPCKAELPLLRSAWARSAGKVAFIGVDVNDSRSNALSLVSADHVGYTLASDPSGALAVRLGLLSLPDTVFIDPADKVAHTQIGQLDAKTLGTWLGRLEAGS